MSDIQHSENLNVVADNYVVHLNELLALLERENEALKNREFECIGTCTAKKEILLSKLEQLDVQGLILEQQTTTKKPSPFNKQFTSLLKKCSELNAVNGGIVEISKQFNQRMLNTILGAATQNDALYDSAGNSSASRLKQVFAKI